MSASTPPRALPAVPADVALPGVSVMPPAWPAHIPAAAWSRPIGLPAPEAGRAMTITPALLDDGSDQGLPLGGLGSGAIGRTHRGDFASWHLDVGTRRYATAWADQFSVFVEQDGVRQAHVLTTARPDGALAGWQWDYPVGAGSYYALFPRAWFDYQWDQLPVRLTQEQFSPVIPGNEREASYPVAVFEWRATNPTDRPLQVGLMLTWENFLGQSAPTDAEVGAAHQARHAGAASGVELRRAAPFSGAPWDGSIAIAALASAGVAVSYRRHFAADGDGADLWADFAADGRLDDGAADEAGTGKLAGAAVAVTFALAPGETKVIPFALTWDQPVVVSPAGTRWHKHYARFTGAGGDQAWPLAVEALTSYRGWREQIEAWQAPILADPARPLWYKTALFNELYFLVAGGTLWVDPANGPADGPGQFAYLECYDYPFYATHDVAFYSSWALLALWPSLERQELRQFAATVPAEELTEVTIQATGAIAPRKLAGALPHDLGAPFEDPLVHSNAYAWQNINDWKDLNLKYVLRTYRDYLLLADRALLAELWPTIPVALDYLRKFDSDGDGLLDHDGADQTYDTWLMRGASAYASTLLIAALEATVRMAEIMDDQAHAAQYADWLAQSRASFEAKLWHGSYYLYNTGDNHHRDSIMADQLVGQWYAGALGLPAVAPDDHIQATLKTIFQHNVMGFAGGTMGAVNGMRPTGEIDESDMQSREVWTGTTYALAALMMQEGLTDEAWRTAWGVYYTTYVTHGLWFRTPEAWDEHGTFRACLYMRPQSIWALEHALSQR